MTDLSNVRGVHLDVPYGTDEIDDATLLYTRENEDSFTYMLALEVDDETEHYSVDLDIPPAVVEEAALMDDDFSLSVEEVDAYPVEVDEAERL